MPTYKQGNRNEACQGLSKIVPTARFLGHATGWACNLTGCSPIPHLPPLAVMIGNGGLP